jgi:hypothetical protein
MSFQLTSFLAIRVLVVNTPQRQPVPARRPMSICSASVARVGFSSEFHLAASDALHIVFIMVTNVVLTVSRLQLLFMHQSQNSL